MINLGSKLNVMTLTYIAKLGLKTENTKIGVYKINGLLLNIYNIVITGFWVWDKFSKSKFFHKTFFWQISAWKWSLT